jgi:hypothetical protein
MIRYLRILDSHGTLWRRALASEWLERFLAGLSHGKAYCTLRFVVSPNKLPGDVMCPMDRRIVLYN